MKAAALLLAFAATTAQAEFFTGNKLHQWATEMNSSTIFWAMLHGYVSGAYDMGVGSAHCAPSSITLGQVVDMVKLHLENNPAIRHASGDLIVTFVARQAWPCPKRESRQGGNL